MISCFFGEDLSEVGIFQQKEDFGFHLLSGDGKFSCCHELGNKRGVWKESFTIATEDSVDLVIVQGVLEVLVLHVVVEVVIEVGIIDSVYVDMSVSVEKGFSKEGIVPLGVCAMGGVEILRLIAGFRDGQGLFDPVDGGVCGAEPGES